MSEERELIDGEFYWVTMNGRRTVGQAFRPQLGMGWAFEVTGQWGRIYESELEIGKRIMTPGGKARPVPIVKAETDVGVDAWNNPSVLGHDALLAEAESKLGLSAEPVSKYSTGEFRIDVSIGPTAAGKALTLAEGTPEDRKAHVSVVSEGCRYSSARPLFVKAGDRVRLLVDDACRPSLMHSGEDSVALYLQDRTFRKVEPEDQGDESGDDLPRSWRAGERSPGWIDPCRDPVQPAVVPADDPPPGTSYRTEDATLDRWLSTPAPGTTKRRWRRR